MAAIHLRVVGRVQGVGFRWFVRQQAVRLGVSGWVKNTDSGDVEVAASGDEAKLGLLEAAVSRGPAGASVQQVERVPPPTATTYPTPFRIER
ncbi:MAG TPA: acylphosphatase [Gemmatimonadaceae bacterium]|nr:acylphosphatase [Gemmatimonadaceae bacterium]